MMPRKELIEEHEKLVPILKEHNPEEYKEQKEELQELRGYDDGGLIDNSKQDALRKLIGDSPKLSEDDFTQPGQMIPKDAGFGDFLKYNAAHINPEDLAMQMGTMSGGIKKIPGIPLIKTGAKEFSGAVKNAMESSPMHKQNITPYAEKDYEGFKTFLTPDNKSGYAIKPDGELINVFSTEKGRGNDIVKHAVQQGATKLDALNINNKLKELYGKHGFESYKTEKNYTPGGPDVDYMALRDKHPELFSSADKTPIVPTDPNIRLQANAQANAKESALKEFTEKQRQEKLNELTTPREIIPEQDFINEELERKSLSNDSNKGMPPARPDIAPKIKSPEEQELSKEMIKDLLSRLIK